MVINHNISALNTFNQLSKNEKAQQSSLAKLSSGLRINSAADDAAGLAISQKMQAQINGLDQSTSNAQNGISMIQTAEGALNETQSILQRMNTLAVQSANDTNTGVDRGQIQKEMDQLASEVTRIANDTEFNSQKLVNGAINDTTGLGASTFQIGASEGQTLQISIGAMDAKSLGVSRDVTQATVATGATAITGASVDPAVTAGSEIAASKSIAVTHGAITDAAASATVKAASALTDTLTINTVATGAAGNNLKINLTTNSADTLSVTASGDTINIALADTTAGNNTAAKITTALQALGTVDGVDLSGATATAGGNWDTAAKATGEAGAVDFTGGSTADATKEKITLTESADSKTEDIIVDKTATSVTASSTGDFAGLSFTTSDATTAAGTINISTDAATAATFDKNAGTTVAAHATAGLNVSSRTAASNAISAITAAINTVSTQRAQLGAYQNRLDHTINNLSTESQNLTSASSAITDVDMAKEMTTYTKNNILNQAAQAMLAQANQLPQGILQLLK